MKRPLEVGDDSGDESNSDMELQSEQQLGDDVPEIPEDRSNFNKERNKEHAKRTRLRKKEMIEGMKGRLLDLQKEVIVYCFFLVDSTVR